MVTSCLPIVEPPGFPRSLSWAVDDALFSFWRLSLPQRRAIDAAVPPFVITLDGSSRHPHFDWHEFLASLEATEDTTAPTGPRSIHVAWTLALHAETSFDEAIVPHLQRETIVSLSTDVLVHGATVRRLLTRLCVDLGDYYMTFVILITVLEKALYDLYHQHQRTTTEENKKKNLILRDLLHSTELATVLPPGMMALLKILFLPSGLNLRNLVWHGFMIPAQFPRCFACLTVMLLLELPAYFTDTTTSTKAALFQLEVYNDRFRIPDEFEHVLSNLKKTHDLYPLLSLGWDSSAFIPRGWKNLVRRALRALTDKGDELWFLFALLPVLEHAIRMQFVRSNTALYGLALDDFCVAQIDQYYSTLDGFGQRDKHQVLLHSELAGHDPTILNALYQTMPRAAMAVCLDLFMMAAGPNVRAKLCHGEADLSTLALEDTKELPLLSTITKLVVFTWISLCRVYDHQSSHDAKGPRWESPPALQLFNDSINSSFHPFYQLCRLSDACENRLKIFSRFCAQWANVRITHIGSAEDTDQLARLEFLSSDAEVVVGITDKTFRIQEFVHFYDRLSTPVTSTKKSKSFAEFLSVFEARVADATQKLMVHNESTHSTIESHAIDPQVDRCMLALSDTDGLSVSACMMDILASIHRSLESFETRFSTLVRLIQDGSARTNQRRAFLNNVFFLPVFEQTQRLTFNLVTHQIEHLKTVAVRQCATLRGSTAPELCSDARKFEQLQRKLLQFITAFEGCTGSVEGAQKSSEKALQLGLQFLDSKAMRVVLG